MNRAENFEQALTDFEAIRKSSPLVHNITNYVVMNFTANALLSIGASPVMAHSVNEVDEMASIASSLVINIGTLSPEWVEGMVIASKSAHKKGIPVVFDPVGAGATSYRNEVCRRILEECKPTIIRGNGSEITSLVSTIATKGVDSTVSSSSAVDAAKELALATGAVVVISGEIDYVTDGKRVASNEFGSTMMTQVTGMGCASTAILGAFAAVNPSAFEAALSCVKVIGVAGQVAASYSKGNGSLSINFLDELYNFSASTLEQAIKLSDKDAK